MLFRSCTACGLCARRCPTGNIVMKDGKPRFGSECTTCLRCVYACPSKAITTRHLKPVSIPGGYDFSRAQAEAEARKDETPVKVPPFLAAYEADIDK